MKRYVRSAVKVTPSRFNKKENRWVEGKHQEYTDAKEMIAMLNQAGFDKNWHPDGSEQDGEIVFSSPVNLISGPGELQVVANIDAQYPSFSKYFVKLVQNGQTLFEKSLYETCHKDSGRKALESIARAEAKNVSKIADPDYQVAQERKRRIAKAKGLSNAELLNQIRDYTNLPQELAEEAIYRLRRGVKSDNEWARCYDWVLEEGEKSTENWADISIQGYGYTTTYTINLDTGYNTYTTTISDTRGWHTE